MLGKLPKWLIQLILTVLAPVFSFGLIFGIMIVLVKASDNYGIKIEFKNMDKNAVNAIWALISSSLVCIWSNISLNLRIKLIALFNGSVAGIMAI